MLWNQRILCKTNSLSWKNLIGAEIPFSDFLALTHFTFYINPANLYFSQPKILFCIKLSNTLVTLSWNATLTWGTRYTRTESVVLHSFRPEENSLVLLQYVYSAWCEIIITRKTTIFKTCLLTHFQRIKSLPPLFERVIHSSMCPVTTVIAKEQLGRHIPTSAEKCKFVD